MSEVTVRLHASTNGKKLFSGLRIPVWACFPQTSFPEHSNHCDCAFSKNHRPSLDYTWLWVRAVFLAVIPFPYDQRPSSERCSVCTSNVWLPTYHEDGDIEYSRCPLNVSTLLWSIGLANYPIQKLDIILSDCDTQGFRDSFTINEASFYAPCWTHLRFFEPRSSGGGHVLGAGR